MSLSSSVRMEQLGSHCIDFHEIWYWSIFLKSVKKIHVSLKSDMYNGYFTWRLIYILTYLAVSRSVLIMGNVSGKMCGEKSKHAFYIQNFFFRKNLTVYEVMWTNIEETGRPQITIWLERISCLIAKATNTQSEYAILTTFPPQQWSHERTSILRHTHIPCLVFFFHYENRKV